MKIELEPISQSYIPKEPGKYLVRTISTGILKRIQFIEVSVQKWYDNKKEE